MSARAKRQACESATVTTDRIASSLAHELEIFLERAAKKRRRSSSQRESLDSFAEIIAPAVKFGLTRLSRVAHVSAKRILSVSVRRSLARHLAQRLVFALGPTLKLEQNIARAVARTSTKRNPPRSGKITLWETVREFPGALEVATQLIAPWVDAQRELLARLVRDQPLLSSVFLRNREAFRITAIRPGLSDPHNGNRSATLIAFTGNCRVIYKPRSGDGEQLWFAALRWLNQNGLATPFLTPGLVSRKGYLWMEFLRTRGCQKYNAVRRFYFRWGAQAALAQILGASDLHRDNWLAVGSQPVLVDAELIAGANSRSLSALLETGLLPLIARDRAGLYRGIAPFDATCSGAGPPRCWPRCKGKPQPPWKYVDDLVRGFEAVAGIFAQRDVARQFFREIVSRPARRLQPRVLLRASAEYGRLLRQSLAAAHMISPRQRFRWLVRTCVASAPTRSIGLAEARALLRCDIPKFTTRGRTFSRSWKHFSSAIQELQGDSPLLRRRILLRDR